MANILIGSSNVYRNFERAVSSGRFADRDLQLVRCTKKAVFDSYVAGLTSADLVVTSVLENFLNDVCTGVPDDEIQLFAHQQITAHVESLLSLSTRLPELNILICPPMYRSVPAWYGSYLPDILGFLASEVTRVDSSRIGLCSPFVVVPSMLEEDGVHLTPSGGDRFMAHLDSELQTMLQEVPPTPDAASTTPMDQDVDVISCQVPTVVPLTFQTLNTIEALGEAVTSLVKSTSDFETYARRRFRNDDFVFARLKEEADTDLNRSREDRVVLTGLPNPPTSMRSHAEKKKHYSDAITRLLTLACAAIEPVPKVEDVYVNIRKGQGQPLVEARFETVSGAQAFRRESVKLAKAEHSEFSSLFISNSVTQSTRVRIEVLKALGKRLTSTTETAYVQGFISRPVLQYHAKTLYVC